MLGALREDGYRVCYVVDHYPAVSHTFILREVEALRRAGVTVETVSLHDSADQVLAEADRRAYATTYRVSPPRPADLVVAGLLALLSRPRRLFSTLALALALAGRSYRHRVWGLFYFGEAVLVWRHARRRRVRHLHAHFTQPGPDVALLAAHLGGAGWSWSFTAHGGDIYNTSRPLLSEKARRATAIACVSDFGRGQMLELVGEEHWEKIRVVRCGLDLDRFPAPDRPSRDGDEPLRVLSVGRLASEKGQSVLLEALAELRRRGVAVAATLVGDGPRADALRGQADRLGLAGLVTFTGRVGQDDIRAYYEGADVFCLTSFTEGVPVVLMEAMAMELPIVASGIMGIPELVEHERSGLLVPPARPDLLADAIERLAADPALRRRYGSRGREKVRAEFDVDRSAQQLRALLAGATGGAPA
jgi:glycosyltransferase involved in cell wall biosynthesis